MQIHILDSSAWLECLENGPNTLHFSPILRNLPHLIVPSICITEVRKVVLQQRSREKADEVTQAMLSGIVIPIDEKIAADGADLFIQYKLPLADALIYAVTIAHNAILWTQDSDFEGLPHVKYYPKIKTP